MVEESDDPTVAAAAREAAVQAAIAAAAVTVAAGVRTQGPEEDTSATMIAPRIGGSKKLGKDDYFWTGGGAAASTTLTEPRTMKAYRPSDFKSQVKMEESCTAGLPATHHLSTPDKLTTDTKAVSFKTWIDRIRDEIEQRGMDSVFRIQGQDSEIYILETFGKATRSTVEDWVKQLSEIGVQGKPVCMFDKDNLQMSGTMIRHSLDIDMLKKVENDVPAQATGPEVFAAVVNIHQALSSSAVRVLVAQLQALKLGKEPAENVESFADKVTDIAKRIQGTGPDTCPQDLHTLVYECFIGSSTSIFQSDVVLVYNQADRGDPAVKDWDKHVSEFKARYRTLKTKKMWEAEKHHKEKVEIQALKATVKRLEKKSSDGVAAKSGGGSDGRKCYHCGKEGHIKPNCPDKDKPKVAGAGTPAPAASGASKGFSRKTAPKEGEAHTKNAEGEAWKWCGTCKRWNKGEKAHSTDEHVKGKGKPAEAKAEANNAVAAALASNDTGPSLRLVSGYMAGIGRTIKPSELEYCADCDYFHRGDEGHDTSYVHAKSKSKEALLGFQCNCADAGEWILQGPRKAKKHLKGFAGHR